eukprot:g13613.t1
MNTGFHSFLLLHCRGGFSMLGNWRGKFSLQEWLEVDTEGDEVVGVSGATGAEAAENYIGTSATANGNGHHSAPGPGEGGNAIANAEPPELSVGDEGTTTTKEAEGTGNTNANASASPGVTLLEDGARGPRGSDTSREKIPRKPISAEASLGTLEPSAQADSRRVRPFDTVDVGNNKGAKNGTSTGQLQLPRTPWEQRWFRRFRAAMAGKVFTFEKFWAVLFYFISDFIAPQKISFTDVVAAKRIKTEFKLRRFPLDDEDV